MRRRMRKTRRNPRSNKAVSPVPIKLARQMTRPPTTYHTKLATRNSRPHLFTAGAGFSFHERSFKSMYWVVGATFLMSLCSFIGFLLLERHVKRLDEEMRLQLVENLKAQKQFHDNIKDIWVSYRQLANMETDAFKEIANIKVAMLNRGIKI